MSSRIPSHFGDSGVGKPPVVLTIAGFDPSSGAGITADLQVFAAHGLFGISAITALTVQSTQGVFAVASVDENLLQDTLGRLAEDFLIAGVKLGMMSSRAAVQEVAKFLASRIGPEQVNGRVVLDPVLRSSSGASLLAEGGLEAMAELLAVVTWITPNWAELSALSGCPVQSLQDAANAAEVLGQSYPHLHIVATGGDADGVPVDLWRSPDGQITELAGSRIETTSTHGTGCAYSSALLSALILGRSPEESVRGAKAYVESALRHAPGLGRGRGPMGLLWPFRRDRAVLLG